MTKRKLSNVNLYGFKAWAEAFAIFAKYQPEKKFCVNAEHDQIYTGDIPPEKMSDEDRSRLDELGWYWDGEDLDRWRHST
jgi:hypothetical protein